MLSEARRILKTVFGYDDFIFLQERVLENVLERRETLAVMPTGGGKSVCYQIPALLWDGLTVVVSPLISLMKDQVDQLLTLGVPAVMLSSSLTEEQYRSNVAAIRAGRAWIVYMAPETARHPAVMDLLRSCQVELLAIDEAHCISEWGPDFRPEYRRLAELRDAFPDAVCLALTATATPRVRRDILECLRMSSAAEVVAGFNRENLFLKVDYKVDPLGQVLRVIGRFPRESGIIYCHTRRRGDFLCGSLQDRGIPAAAYHAGLDDAQRRRAQELFVGDDIRVMVATVAFGMGIDKSNVWYVIHYDLPKNLEGYYQEIGRSGRDGLPAECVLLFSHADAAGRRRHIQRLEDPLLRRAAPAQLDAMVRFAETESCRRIPLLGYFGEETPEANCNMCDNCTEPDRPALDVTVPAQKLLSCVVRTGQRFGAGYVVSVLCGSKTKRILENRHHELSTHGIGTEYSPRGWRSLAECLTWRGLLERDSEFGALRLTREGWDVLRSRHPIHVRWHPLDEAMPGQAADPDAEEAAFPRELFERLRKKRRESAQALGVPPYVIFSDRSLADMAARMPQTPEEMLAVHGVGEGKLERFGEDFLSVFRDFRREHPDVQPVPSASTPTPKTRSSGRTGRHHQVAKAFNQGRSLDDLCRDFGVQKRTVLWHLRRYQMEGCAPRWAGPSTGKPAPGRRPGPPSREFSAGPGGRAVRPGGNPLGRRKQQLRGPERPHEPGADQAGPCRVAPFHRAGKSCVPHRPQQQGAQKGLGRILLSRYPLPAQRDGPGRGGGASGQWRMSAKGSPWPGRSCPERAFSSAATAARCSSGATARNMRSHARRETRAPMKTCWSASISTGNSPRKRCGFSFPRQRENTPGAPTNPLSPPCSWGFGECSAATWIIFGSWTTRSRCRRRPIARSTWSSSTPSRAARAT
ncbi:MAG: DNA helicase RecQ [Desulfosoma sp.]